MSGWPRLEQTSGSHLRLNLSSDSTTRRCELTRQQGRAVPPRDLRGRESVYTGASQHSNSHVAEREGTALMPGSAQGVRATRATARECPGGTTYVVSAASRKRADIVVTVEGSIRDDSAPVRGGGLDTVVIRRDGEQIVRQYMSDTKLIANREHRRLPAFGLK